MVVIMSPRQWTRQRLVVRKSITFLRSRDGNLVVVLLLSGRDN